MRTLLLVSVTASLVAPACGGPISVRSNEAGASSGPDAAEVAFVPARRGADAVAAVAALAALAVPIDKAKALFDTLPEAERSALGAEADAGGAGGAGGTGDPGTAARPTATAYDLDRDGALDLVALPQGLDGPSKGWSVYLAERGTLRKAFALSGDWADVHTEGGAVMLRFEAAILAPGEARFSTTLRFAKGVWDPPIKSYVAVQTKLPAAQRPYGSFSTRGKAALRTTPVIDDKLHPIGADAAAGSLDRTTTIRGNVVAIYRADARGKIIARDGMWRYVAFDPATKPRGTTLMHSMDMVLELNLEATAEENDEISWLCIGDCNSPEALQHRYEAKRPPPQLLSNAWLCGWMPADQIVED